MRAYRGVRIAQSPILFSEPPKFQLGLTEFTGGWTRASTCILIASHKLIIVIKWAISEHSPGIDVLDNRRREG
jgi:hypothetical protein